ncbi:glycosyl hydrolase family protein [Artemisia annua]|uniref:Glycosyl hydrolase family protein n=1 Tax=Artemisia annua TaxID=35608 RepID=A0A2U1LRF0_ARTAN|nr:glycosyl hydrolase family protein [Artemisia annua]
MKSLEVLNFGLACVALEHANGIKRSKTTTFSETSRRSKSPEDVEPLALKAGMDINCGTYTVRHTKFAVDNGKVEEVIDKALLNLRRCALLKNDNKFLPLQKHDVSSLAVIGPMENVTDELGEGYIGVPCSPTSIVEGLTKYVKKTNFSSGCTDLVTTIAATSKKRIVLVLTGGRPLDVLFAQGNPRIASIIWIGYPGEAGGRALAEIIFGDHNPVVAQVHSNIFAGPENKPISGNIKLDVASVLGDAIKYLKELLQKINALNHELKETP